MAEVATKKSALKGKGWMVAVAVLAACVALLFWDQKAPPPRDPDSPPPISDYAHVSAGDVTRAEVKRPDGGFTLVKQNGEWTLQAPLQARADTKKVDDWIKGVLDATVTQKVEGKPAESVTGFDKPTVELVLGTRGETRTLQIGKQPQGTGSTTLYYAREPKDGRIFVLGNFQVDDLKNKKVDDLRDKKLLAVAEEKDVQKISVQRPAGPLEIERKGPEKWELAQPFRAPADKMDVESLISQVRSAEADSFVPNSGDLAKYGLDQPRLTLQVTDNKGQHRLLFGKLEVGKDGKVFALREGEREVMKVAKSTFDSFDKKPADLREKQLVNLESDKIGYVELKNTHGVVKLQKTSGNVWRFVEGGSNQAKAKADMVQKVIDAVRQPAFKHVEEAPTDLAKYGLDKAQIIVQVSPGTGSTEVFMVGKRTKDGNYYVKGTPSAVFEVLNYVYADLNVKPDAFKDTTK
jgi:hypothetical protein